MSWVSDNEIAGTYNSFEIDSGSYSSHRRHHADIIGSYLVHSYADYQASAVKLGDFFSRDPSDLTVRDIITGLMLYVDMVYANLKSQIDLQEMNWASTEVRTSAIESRLDKIEQRVDLTKANEEYAKLSTNLESHKTEAMMLLNNRAIEVQQIREQLNMQALNMQDIRENTLVNEKKIHNRIDGIIKVGEDSSGSLLARHIFNNLQREDGG